MKLNVLRAQSEGTPEFLGQQPMQLVSSVLLGRMDLPLVRVRVPAVMLENIPLLSVQRPKALASGATLANIPG